MLSIPLLGEAAVTAYGETYPEARRKLNEVKRDFLEMWLAGDVDIPEPQDEFPQAVGWLDAGLAHQPQR